MVEAIPEIPFIAIAFTALVAILLMRGMLAAWQSTLGALFEFLGSHLNFSFSVLGVHVPLDIGAPFKYADHYIIIVMQKALNESEHLLAWSLHGMAVLAEWMTSETLSLATSVEQAFERLGHIHLPRWVKAAVGVAFPPALLFKSVRAAVAGELADLRGYVDARLREIERKIARDVKRTVPGVIVAIPGLRALTHEYRSLRDLIHAHTRRLARLEKLLAASGLAIALANVLGLPNWRCLTRGNLGRTARHICGLSAGALENLLGLIADAVILTNICTAITLLQEGLALIQPAITAFIGGADAIACYGGNVAPPTMAVPALTLPGAVDATLHLA